MGLYGYWTHFKVKTKKNLTFFQIFVLLFYHLSINTNELQDNYFLFLTSILALFLPSNTRTKEEKKGPLRGHNYSTTGPQSNTEAQHNFTLISIYESERIQFWVLMYSRSPSCCFLYICYMGISSVRKQSKYKIYACIDYDYDYKVKESRKKGVKVKSIRCSSSSYSFFLEISRFYS